MLYCKEILICILIIILLLYVSNGNKNKNNNKDTNNNSKVEKFDTSDQQTYPFGRKLDLSIFKQYGEKKPEGAFQSKSPLMGASDNTGSIYVSANNASDARGLESTEVGNRYNVDVKTSMMNDSTMRNKFQNMYMLDPNGDIGNYDVSNMPSSKHCCPAQYSVPFMGDDNCSFANKYVANNYMSMNYGSEGNGCPCMTPEQADFYSQRGGNASVS